LHVLVCIKQVPDTQKVRIDPERGTLIRKGIPSITNPFDETALELAFEIRESVGGRVSVLTMGIPDSECILRDALTLGADDAYLLTGSGFAGADTLATSYALSLAIEKTGPFDLVLFGKQAIDGDTAQVGPEVAGQLGYPVVTFVQDLISVDHERVVVDRMIDRGRETVEVDLPAVLTVVKAEQRLRVPTFTTILNGFAVPVTRLGPNDIGADPGRCGLKGSPTRVKKVFAPKHQSSVSLFSGSVEESAGAFVRTVRELGII